jgi:hypothetical protein
MEFIAVDAPPLLARSETSLRTVARHIACGNRKPDDTLVIRARGIKAGDLAIGRVQSRGSWSDDHVRAELVAALGAPLASALRPSFEWYVCRGAFFHTDAHYADVMFGVWYIDGPPVDIVFARPGVRLPALPGSIVVFDPFEVHGVLHTGAREYVADEYGASAASVFAGFELDLDDPVRVRFGIVGPAAGARVISSSTRVSAMTGSFE